MKIIFYLFLFFNLSVFSQNNFYNVRFKVITENIDTSSTIYITGNHLLLGNWNPGLVKLEKMDSFWEGVYNFQEGQVIEFKFTLGSWDLEELDNVGKIPQNHRLIITKDTSLSFSINAWNNQDNDSSYYGQITGTLVYHKNFKYDGLLPRDITVWLPPDYYENIDEKYPVLYMHDGQNLFDPKTSFGNVDWQLDEAADSLIKNVIIRPIIIVGIYNTKDRGEEYSDSEKGLNYMKFIVTRLKPFIDNTYRTLPGRENAAVGGASSGGLSAFLLGWNYSSYFSKAACFSPAFKYDSLNFTNIVRDYSGTAKDHKIFIYNGGLGLDKYLQEGVDEMIIALENKNYLKDKDFFVRIDSTAEHNELEWSKHVPEMLEIFFRKTTNEINAD